MYWAGASLAVLAVLSWWLWPRSSTPVETLPLSESVGPATDAGEGATAQPSIPAVVEVQVDSGATVRMQERPRLTVPTPPYGPHYAALLTAAEGGDPKAQYQLGLMLHECREIPVVEAELSAQIDRMHQTHRLNGWEVSDPEQEEKALRQDFQDCQGLPALARDDYRQWVARAADAGLIEAQLNLMYHLPKGRYCQFIEDCTPEQREVLARLREEGRVQVQKALEAGSVEALRTFGAWYLNDEMFDPNPIEAYAYFLAYDQVMRAAGKESPVQAMLESLRRRLRPVDLDQGAARAAELLSNPNCCILTP
jgi:TPR repeat protein